jgi:hypothetical protein
MGIKHELPHRNAGHLDKIIKLLSMMPTRGVMTQDYFS